MPKVMLVKHRQIYVNITPSSETEQYEKMCAGFESANVSGNPNVVTHTYICESNAHNDVLSYAKQLSCSGVRMVGDAVNDFIAGLEDAVGSDSHTKVVIAEFNSDGTAIGAKRYDATIVVNSLGGDGGGEVSLDVTMHLNGAPEPGTFNATTKQFSLTP